jgi:hypothetical protein
MSNSEVKVTTVPGSGSSQSVISNSSTIDDTTSNTIKQSKRNKKKAIKALQFNSKENKSSVSGSANLVGVNLFGCDKQSNENNLPMDTSSSDVIGSDAVNNSITQSPRKTNANSKKRVQTHENETDSNDDSQDENDEDIPQAKKQKLNNGKFNTGDIMNQIMDKMIQSNQTMMKAVLECIQSQGKVTGQNNLNIESLVKTVNVKIVRNPKVTLHSS